MKKLLTILLLIPSIAFAQVTPSDLIQLGMSPELSTKVASIGTGSAVMNNNSPLKWEDAAGTGTVSAVNVTAADSLALASGATAGADITISATDAITFNTAGTNGWTINSDKELVNNASTGNNIIFNRAGTGVRVVPYVPTMAATPVAGTNIISGKVSVIPTAAANTAALLPAAPGAGDLYQILNTGPNTVRVKAGSGDAINGGSADNYIAIATFQQADCMALSSAAWNCSLKTVPTPAGP